MKKDLEFDKHQVHLRTLLWFRIPSSQFRQPLQLVIEVHGNFLSKGVPWQIENLKNRIGTKKNENHLFRGVGSLTRHWGHVWTLGAHSEQMMWESGHMKIGGLAVSRQIGHLRSSSFFSMPSLRNLIILLHLSRYIGQVKSSSIFTTASSRT